MPGAEAAAACRLLALAAGINICTEPEEEEEGDLKVRLGTLKHFHLAAIVTITEELETLSEPD